MKRLISKRKTLRTIIPFSETRNFNYLPRKCRNAPRGGASPTPCPLVQKYKFIISEDTRGSISLCRDDFLRCSFSPGLATFIPMGTLFIGVYTTHGTQLTRG